MTPTPNYGVTQCTEVHETPAEKQALKKIYRHTQACLFAYYGKPLTLFTELLVFMLITLCEYGNCSQNIKPTQITKLHSNWSTSIHMRCTIKKHNIFNFSFKKYTQLNCPQFFIVFLFLYFFPLSLSLWKWTSRRTCTVVRNTKHTLYLFFSLSKGACLKKPKNWRWRNGMMS